MGVREGGQLGMGNRKKAKREAGRDRMVSFILIHFQLICQFFCHINLVENLILGPFKCYVMQMGVGVSDFLGKKRYEGVRGNVISVTRGWVGSNFQKKALRNT